MWAHWLGCNKKKVHVVYFWRLVSKPNEKKIVKIIIEKPTIRNKNPV